MENTSGCSIAVNLTDSGTRHGGAGAYAAFCARAAAEEFGARLVRTPPWVALLPIPAASLVRYALSRAQLRHFPGIVYNPTYRAVPGHPSQVVTVFDLIPLRHPLRNRLQRHYFARVLPGVLRTALRVITLCEEMKRQVAEAFGIGPDRIAVVPPGVDRKLFSPGPGAQGAGPYLLAAGASLPHKNVHELLERHDLWAGRYRLIVTGAQPPYRRRLRAQARALGIAPRVSVRAHTSAEALVELYRGCAALVYPSLDEGFGLPPLEALSCGRPVIVSDIAVHREVCGGAAFYVRPGDPDSWRTAFEGLNTPAETGWRVEAGTERVRFYSWERTRERLVEALRDLTP